MLKLVYFVKEEILLQTRINDIGHSNWKRRLYDSQKNLPNPFKY